MRAVFIELPPFTRRRAQYLDDEGFRALQVRLLMDPVAGALIQGTGGLRKLRVADPRRGKGRRGGLRVIYYWWDGGAQFWLMTLFDKDEMTDLTADQRGALADMIKAELAARSRA